MTKQEEMLFNIALGGGGKEENTGGHMFLLLWWAGSRYAEEAGSVALGSPRFWHDIIMSFTNNST